MGNGNGSLSMLRADQLAPHNIEAEHAVLGSLLIRADLTDTVRALLRSDDFFIVRHQWIYEAILSLKARRKAVDHLTVSAELEQRGQIDEIGGLSYLMDLHSYSPFAENIETYARIVQEMALRRRLIETGGQIARLAHSDETDISTVLNQSVSAVSGVNEDYVKSVETTQSLGDLVLSIQVEADEWKFDPRPYRGLSFGYEDVNEATGGLQPGEMTIVCGRPGMGKTAWLCEIVRRSALSGQRVLYFSMEMSAKVLARRMICQDAQISSRKLKQGRLHAGEWDRFHASSVHLMETLNDRIFIEQRSGMTVSQMESVTRKYARQEKIGIVVVDTGNKVAPSHWGNREYDNLTLVSHDLAAWFMNEGIAGLVAVQLSRAGANPLQGPTLDNLRGTGAWEEDARQVISIHRPAYYTPEETDPLKIEETFIEVLKNTNDESSGFVKLAWRPEYTGFENVSRYQLDERFE